MDTRTFYNSYFFFIIYFYFFIAVSLVYPLLGLVGWDKHWIKIAVACILVISPLLDHSFTELFLEIGIVSRYMSVKVQR